MPASTTLSPGQHYLFTNSSTSGGPYSGSVPGDETYSVGIADNGGDGWVPLTRGQPDIVRELRAEPDWPTRPMSIVRLTQLLPRLR